LIRSSLQEPIDVPKEAAEGSDDLFGGRGLEEGMGAAEGMGMEGEMGAGYGGEMGSEPGGAAPSPHE
jgi:hypothetical protein